jgi:hypothetical protein
MHMSCGRGRTLTGRRFHPAIITAGDQNSRQMRRMSACALVARASLRPVG